MGLAQKECRGGGKAIAGTRWGTSLPGGGTRCFASATFLISTISNLPTRGVGVMLSLLGAGLGAEGAEAHGGGHLGGGIVVVGHRGGNVVLVIGHRRFNGEVGSIAG